MSTPLKLAKGGPAYCELNASRRIANRGLVIVPDEFTKIETSDGADGSERRDGGILHKPILVSRLLGYC